MFLILLFVSSLAYTANAQCHTPYDNYIGNLCYQFSDQPLNYQAAQNYCHGRSLNLAVVGTTLQANFLASTVRTKTGSNDALFWIGLSRSSLSARFQWDDGTALSWSNFDSNFPRDNLYVAESVVNGKWQTLNGMQSLYFVCSYDPRNVTPGTAQPSTTGYNSPSTTGAYTTGYGTTTTGWWPVSTQTTYQSTNTWSTFIPSTTSGYTTSPGTTDSSVSTSSTYGSMASSFSTSSGPSTTTTEN